MNFVGKPKPVICDIDLCKFHRTCYTSTASAVFWQEDAFQRKLEYDHTSSLNSAHLSPKELNSLPTSHPIRKNQVPLRLKSCSASEISPFFFLAMGIHSVFNHSNTWNEGTSCYLWTQKIHVWSLFSSSKSGFFGPLSTSCFSKNKSDAEESDKEFSRSGTIFWRKKSTISNQKSTIHTGKSETITMNKSKYPPLFSIYL